MIYMNENTVIYKEKMMKKFLFMLAAVCSLSACSEDEAKLNGKTFALLPEKAITIAFDEKEPSFYGQAVNNYFGEYNTEKNNITLKLQGSTMMAAPEAEMKKETEYFQNLGKIKTYTLKGNSLELQGDGITLKYEQTNN